MEWFKRYTPLGVSFIGSLGLGLTLTYFIGVGLAFQPGWEAWADSFSYWGPRLVFLPAGLLLVHLYCRMHLGEWLVGEGRLEEALDYTADRLDRNLMRSKREALHHRLARVRALVRQQAYDQASGLLWSGYAVPRSGRLAARIRRWQAEIGLRRDRPDSVREAYRQGEKLSGSPTPLARLAAARAELALREETEADFVEHAEGADWLDEDAPRVDWSWILGTAALEDDDEEREWALERLDEIRESVVEELPGRHAEIEAIRAELLDALGRMDEAKEAIARARELPMDEWAKRVCQRVEDEMTR